MYNAFRCGSSLSYSAKPINPARFDNIGLRGVFGFLNTCYRYTLRYTLFQKWYKNRAQPADRTPQNRWFFHVPKGYHKNYGLSPPDSSVPASRNLVIPYSLKSPVPVSLIANCVYLLGRIGTTFVRLRLSPVTVI